MGQTEMANGDGPTERVFDEAPPARERDAAAVPQAREFRQKVKWLMILRVTVVTVLLGSLAVLQLYQERPPAPAVYLLIIGTYFLTIAYSIVFYKIRNLVLFAYFQIIGDVVFEAGVVYATGGLDSAFSFTFIISIIAAGIILFRRGSFMVASLASIAYGALVDLQYYGIILSRPERDYTEGELFYNIFLNIIAFFTVAFLASSLSERLRATREALEEKSIDLQELQTLNDNIVRSMADGLVTVGLDGRITAFNKAAEDITGLSFADVNRLTLSEVFGWEGTEAFFEDEGFRKRPYFRKEIKYRRNEEELLLGMTVSQLRNERSDVTGLLCIIQDLTPMKIMEEEIKKKDRLAAIGELSAGMAHEIRNPLASLSGALQVLKSDLDLADENEALMEIALKEMDRLNNIVTEFLVYARPKSPDKESCDLAGIVRDTSALLMNSRELREGITLEADLPDGPITLRADPAQLRQLLLNLSLNAMQSIPGTGTVTIRARGLSGQALLVVEDNGVGIQKEDIDRIFYPFFSTREGGAGLGLAIVYRIVEEHGGTLGVESEVDRGTRFKILLPTEGSA
ncbi:MAG: PAS domain S-box protein [Nitrospirae bacterium]|nr:PAS domain S-box protein [Nitrospirota bacterium]MBI5694455.1 PAS domain S-box protein [Nitrospirota bacterium]